MLAVYDAFRLRQCSTRLSARTASPACALAGMGRCPAPCQFTITRDDYAELVEGVRACLSRDFRPLVAAVQPRLAQLVAAERFEEAGALAERLESFGRAAIRHHRLASLAACPQIVAARSTADGWELHVIRHGRLVGAALARPGEVPQQVARDLVAVAEWVAAPSGPAPAAIIEETERIADWLELPGVRLIEIEGDWCWPLGIGPSAGEQLRAASGSAQRATA